MTLHTQLQKWKNPLFPEWINIKLAHGVFCQCLSLNFAWVIFILKFLLE